MFSKSAQTALRDILHDYEDVSAEFVWETVQRALPPLKAVLERELDR
jgi:uncharacterized protein with HEPN domain